MAMKGTASYVCYTKDLLGQGATSNVYMGYHKFSGETCAMKTFTLQNNLRSASVQMREFEVMRRLHHKNIVKLIGIEDETQSPTNKVIIMEYCEKGSLYQLLEDPKHAFGLEEKELLVVLSDIAGGMKYLRNNGIIHRDIKPANILVFVEEDGSFTYKLTDFGAARELQEEEQFMSLYGTEEYLHPEMYERAVLRRPGHRHFGADVDLWSLGVTIYHIATGILPFRPFGGRANRETMYELIAKKAEGVISGIQTSKDSPIEWNKELPETCRISIGLKMQLTPLIAGLMTTGAMCWSYDQFFSCVTDITCKLPITVLSLMACSVITIYAKPTATFAAVQELIAAQTDIRASSQLLIHSGTALSARVKPLDPVSTYPQTSVKQPVILLTLDAQEPWRMTPIVIQEFPQFLPEMTMSSDYVTAKGSCAILHVMCRLADQYRHVSRCFFDTVKAISDMSIQAFLPIREFYTQYNLLLDETVKRYTFILECIQLKELYLKKQAPSDIAAQTVAHKLNVLHTEMVKHLGVKLETHRNRVLDVKRYVDQYNERIVDQEEISDIFGHCETCSQNKMCVEKLRRLADDTFDTWQVFKKDKKNPSLTHNEKEMHMFGRKKIEDRSEKGMSLIIECCYSSVFQLHQHTSDWYKRAAQYRDRVPKLEKQVSKLSNEQTVFSDSLAKYEKRYTDLCKTLCEASPMSSFITPGAPNIRRPQGSLGLIMREEPHSVNPGPSLRSRDDSGNGSYSSHKKSEHCDSHERTLSPTGSIGQRSSMSLHKELISDLSQGLHSLNYEKKSLEDSIAENTDLVKKLQTISMDMQSSPSTERSDPEGTMTPPTSVT